MEISVKNTYFEENPWLEREVLGFVGFFFQMFIKIGY